MRNLLKKLHYYIFVRQSKWNLMIVIIPFIIFCIFLYFKNISIEKGNYTIGIVTKKYWPIISHESIIYSYYKHDNKYESSVVYDDRYRPQVGKRYLVQYSSKYDFGGAKIFQDIPVPDSIKSAPPEGWKELPEWAKNA
ncbi:MAG: hypothetical protein ITF99_08730 [Chryseobacterium sp.]|nr:hypothetical protein [Chryseobacterium sp.]